MKKNTIALVLVGVLLCLKSNAQEFVQTTTSKLYENRSFRTSGKFSIGGADTEKIGGSPLNIQTPWGNWMAFVDSYKKDVYAFHNPNNGGRMELFIVDGVTKKPRFGVFSVRRDGNIGMGTNSPLGKLHVAGDTYVDGGWLRVKGQRGVLFQDYGGGFYMTDSSWIRTYGNKNFYHNTGTMRTDGTFEVGPSGNRFRVRTSGNVGIGNGNPSEKLHVEGNLLLDSYNLGNEKGIFFREGHTTNYPYNISILAYDHSNGGVSPDGLSINAYDGVSFSTGANTRNERMRINVNGNVGIGTTAPAEKLHVNGSIRGNISGGALRVKSSHGYIDVGAQNTSWAHIYTDRSKFIFNKDVYSVTNGFSSYNNDLILRTKGTERLRIKDENGYVGIGTNTPYEKLQVGNAIGLHDGGHKILTFMYAYGGGARDLDNTKHAAEVRFDPVLGNLQLGTSGTLTNGPTPRMTINKTGKVGVGLTNPNAKLEVKHAGTIGGKWNPSGSFLTLNDGANSLLMDTNEIYGNSTLHIGSASGDLLKIRAVPTSGGMVDRVVVKANGDVGIGTLNPDAKLAVKGKIHAEEIKIDLSVPAPDYVFLENYDLKTIEEVDTYIKEKGHLPNIPSAKVMEKNGVELGLMNMKLLEKIEELTLYTIDQNQQIKSTTKQLQKLEKENKELEDRLTKLEALLMKKESK
ncbi:shufflon system plasmid conjugative transfer pilus tip adhesin PilV [Tenacibaculum sp. 190524A05c]|uniref:Bacterial shufflon protein N-terminal domain-containing protein n=1 Tax=Tenacibaculum platacis TaxID=3137852 RepID=A0ABP1ERB0_9FLAO